MLVLALTLDVTHGGAGGRANEQGDVSATVIEGVSVGIDGVVVTAVAGIKGAGSVSNDDVGIGNAAAVVVAAVGNIGVVGVGIGRTGIVCGIAFAVAVALTFGIGISVDGASVAGDAGGIDVAGVCDVSVVGVKRAGSGAGASSVIGVEGTCGIDDAAAATVCTVAVEIQGWPGVHEVRSAGSSEVEVKGVLLVLREKCCTLLVHFESQ